MGAPPQCHVAGDCAQETYPASCDGGWSCDDGDSLECSWLCEPGDTPPDSCWDKGPGECADYAPDPTCTDGVWTCPNGFGFGGYGADCTFPGGG